MNDKTIIINIDGVTKNFSRALINKITFKMIDEQGVLLEDIPSWLPKNTMNVIKEYIRLEDEFFKKLENKEVMNTFVEYLSKRLIEF